MSGYQHIRHTFEPVYDENAKILILGTLPSVQSRERGFYYGHPMNRFWKVLAAIFDCPVPETIEDKKKMLLMHRVALWDVIESCDIIGSSDSSIKNAVPADIGALLSKTHIDGIYANGKKAESLYLKYVFPKTQRPITALPSTSPANAACTLERLVEEWGREIQSTLFL